MVGCLVARSHGVHLRVCVARQALELRGDYLLVLFFFKQKTAYEMRISDWSSDVCSADLNNLSTISQTNNLVDGDSSANGAFASQSGNYNNSLIVQNGAGNEAVLAQAGNYNVSVIDQAGSDHVANVAQYSNGNVSGVYQTGVANSATVVQGSAPVAN